MKYFAIKDIHGIVVNKVTAPDDADPSSWNAGPGLTAVNWTDQTVIAPAPETIPESVAPRQLKMWLNHEGLRKTVEAFFASLPDTIESQDAKDYWEYSTEFLRAHPMNLTVGAILGKTSIEIDQAYLAASKL